MSTTYYYYYYYYDHRLACARPGEKVQKKRSAVCRESARSTGGGDPHAHTHTRDLSVRRLAVARRGQDSGDGDGGDAADPRAAPDPFREPATTAAAARVHAG